MEQNRSDVIPFYPFWQTPGFLGREPFLPPGCTRFVPERPAGIYEVVGAAGLRRARLRSGRGGAAWSDPQFHHSGASPHLGDAELPGGRRSLRLAGADDDEPARGPHHVVASARAERGVVGALVLEGEVVHEDHAMNEHRRQQPRAVEREP